MASPPAASLPSSAASSAQGTHQEANQLTNIGRGGAAISALPKPWPPAMPGSAKAGGRLPMSGEGRACGSYFCACMRRSNM